MAASSDGLSKRKAIVGEMDKKLSEMRDDLKMEKQVEKKPDDQKEIDNLNVKINNMDLSNKEETKNKTQ